MQKIVITIVVLVLAIGAYLFLQKSGQQEIVETPTENSQAAKSDASTKTFTSSDSRVGMRFPADWHISDTTSASGNGQFGPYVESWIIQSFPPQSAGQGGISENTAKIDFEIMQGGQNLPLESLVDCHMKTISCERVGIGSELFIKASSMLNTGMQVMQIATFYDNNVFRATAYIQSGEKQHENTVQVEKVFNSITFQNPSD